MVTFFHDLSFLEDDNLVCVSDGREPVGNDNAGLLSSRDQIVKSFLYLVLTLCIKCACSLIQQNDFRLANQGSGDSNTLLLATRQSDATLSDKTIKAFWE